MGLSWLLCKVGRHQSGQTMVPVVARGRVAGAGGGVEEQWARANSALPRGGLWAISELTQGGNRC